MGGKVQRDLGMELAIAGGGGVRSLARRIGVAHNRVAQWRRAPQAMVMRIAEASGVDPESLRPDLAEWIQLRRRQLVLARSRERFAIAAAAASVGGDLPGEEDMANLLMTLAAVRFVARRRGLEMGAVVHGRHKLEEAARSRAMALAAIVARVPHTAIAGVFGCSRQNVDNASLRYQRARDGDDPDDLVDVDDEGFESRREHVIERGRARRAKGEGDPDIWAEQGKFAGVLEGRK